MPKPPFPATAGGLPKTIFFPVTPAFRSRVADLAGQMNALLREIDGETTASASMEKRHG